jgi:DNA-binding NarL/FixJ family response regulator
VWYVQGILLEADDDLTIVLRAIFAHVGISLKVVRSVGMLLQHISQFSPADFIILDCSYSRSEDLDHCAQVVSQVDHLVYIIAPTDDLVVALEAQARGPLVWIRADFGEVMPLFIKLRLLKMQASVSCGQLQQRHLSPRQQEVLVLMAEGRTQSEIAHALGLNIGTVKTYVHRIKSRFTLQ